MSHTWRGGASRELCVPGCCACLASERMENNCERSKQIAEVLLLSALYFQQIPSPPPCLQDEQTNHHPCQVCASCPYGPRVL